MTPAGVRVELNLKMGFKFTGAGALGAVALLALVAACGRPRMPPVTAADATRASSTWPEITLAELDRGRDLYIARCSTCHLPVEPTKIAPAAWPGHIAEMKDRAHLTGDEAQRIERYVVTIAARPRGASARR